MSDKTYLVLNYSSSPVAVSTRYENLLIGGGSNEVPEAHPFTLEEIRQINAGSDVFKVGVLWFEEDYEEEIYEALKIKNWKEIMTTDEIREFILHPTKEKFESVLSITSEFYFERIYGEYIGMRNANYSIPHNVEVFLKARRKEFRNKKYNSEIKIGEQISSEDKNAELMSAMMKDFQSQLEAMKAENERLSAMVANSNKTADEPKVKTEPAKKPGRPKKK